MIEIKRHLTIGKISLFIPIILLCSGLASLSEASNLRVAIGDANKRIETTLKWSTKEQGIKNVRDVIRINRPDIIKRYDVLGSLTAVEEELLRDDIYKITSGHFKIWGLSEAMNSKKTPYFNGSYITALTETFPELDLDPLGFKLDWSTEERGIASIRYVLSKEEPSIIERYDDLGSLPESSIRALLYDIYQITSAHFKVWGLAAAMKSESAPYFKGSYITALAAVFNDPRLGFTEEGLRNFRKNNIVKIHNWGSMKAGLFNIRIAISSRKPHLIGLYDNLDSLNGPEIEVLRNNIYKITSGHFAIWRLGAAMNSQSAPYFNGSYINALRQLFPKLKLNPLGFKLDWSTRRRAIASIRYMLSYEQPHIIEQYNNLDSLNEREIEALRNYIYQITSGHFNIWGLGAAMSSKKAPYFKGSHIIALQAAFPKLKLKQRHFGEEKRAFGFKNAESQRSNL